ncbi:uncharacterized protein LOC126988700 [Eriocheir sinensis]|uniref:uncharacterized protein LOC126988700 n=1 Tax=Eriocheir sinensis TaxID=95602 RepID=UPI0021C85241|nr:uncharacterized protein LOC126988700 [Eriocheir sinensis]
MKGSDERNWRLLALLYRHGGDPNVLKNVVPEWGPERLEHFLRCQRLTSQRRTCRSVYPKMTPWRGLGSKNSVGILSQVEQNRGATVNETPRAMQFLSQWQAHIHNVQRVQGTTIKKKKKGRYSKDFCPADHGPLLSKAMLIISQEEEHPKPSSSSEPDYSEIYRYLSQLLAGQEPTQLSQGSAAKVLEVMEKVQLLASHSLDLKKLYHHLSQNMASYLQPWSKKGADSSPSTLPQGESSSTLPQGESSSSLPQGKSSSTLPPGESSNTSPQGESSSTLLQGESSSTLPQGESSSTSPQGESSSASSQGESSSAEMDECPLFLEVEDQLRTSTKDLAGYDPHCEKVKERLTEKCQKKQEARSLRISELPGLNPFMLPPRLLHKPVGDAVSALLER